MLVILYYSTNAKAAKAVCFKLVCERRVVFILILTAILAYINLRTFGFTVWAFTNPIVTYSIICMDTIILHFPRKASKVFMTVLIINYLFNIYLYTFLRNDCDQNKLPWGIYGQKISYCNVLRLGFQTILSLMLSAAGATLLGKTHDLFFCNANILRSTGTVDSRSKSFEYVQNIFQEKRGGINVFESDKCIMQKGRKHEKFYQRSTQFYIFCLSLPRRNHSAMFYYLRNITYKRLTFLQHL